MGMTGAIKLRQIVEHAERIVAIELMCAAQAWSFVGRSNRAAKIEAAHDAVRCGDSATRNGTACCAPDIDALSAAVRAG